MPAQPVQAEEQDRHAGEKDGSRQLISAPQAQANPHDRQGGAGSDELARSPLPRHAGAMSGRRDVHVFRQRLGLGHDRG